MSKLYELPIGWEWKKLGDICGFIRGPFGGSLKKDIFKESGFAVYEQSHAIYNQFENIRYFIDEAKFEEMKRFELKPNSLIMSCSGTIGKVAIVPSNIKKGIINQALLMLTPIKNLNNVFLKLLMESNFFQDLLSENSTGAAISNVASVKVLKVIEIPLPKFSEQQRIVSKLDLLFKKIDKSIELHKKNMDEANAFMGSVLNEVFVELEEKYGLNNLLDAVYIGCKRGFNPTIIDGKVPFIGMSDIDEKSGLNTQFVMEDYEKVSNGKTKFEKGAVLVGKIFPCTQNNKTSIVPNDIDGGFATTEVYALHCLDNMNPLYLNKYMRSKSINDYMVNTMVGATGRQRVPSETIKSINVPIPPLPIQHKVVEYLDSISEKMEKVTSIQKEKMETLKALKASILDKAFRGEL